MTRLAVLLLALGIYTGALAGSQGPTPARGPVSSRPQQTANQIDSKANQQPPVIVNVSAAPQSNSDSKSDGTNQKAESSGDRGLLIATILIAIANFVMAFGAIWQGRLVKQELLSTFRPTIRVKHLWLDSGWNDRTPLTATLIIINRGATNAKVDEFKFKFYVFGKGERLPDKLLDFPAEIRSSDVLGSGKVWRISPLIGRDISDGEKELIATGKRTLWAVGDIQYRDDLGIARKTAFCRYWESGRFLPLDKPDPDYDYED